MKNQRGFIKIIIVVIMLLLAVGTIYAMRKTVPLADENMIQEDTSNVRAWVITDLGTDEKTGMPKTKVGLIANGTEHDIGTFDGSCKKQDTDMLPNEQEKVVCWWAGGGQEIGIFDERGKTVVKVGDVDEGDAETKGFRGNFVTKFTL